ncbi:hypothetical protein RND71_012446 [Anisodus tanguticus]|uniref:Uncharacterized protein n=1 Tax=Anisodus tanguticus TaxID=243964 RepID=A0AAE1SDA4_9SOLA|nr:hypothetical protein RND71_012446 [Anisodus tanguticus]
MGMPFREGDVGQTTVMLKKKLRAHHFDSKAKKSFPNKEYVEAWSLQSKEHSRVHPQLIKIPDIVSINRQFAIIQRKSSKRIEVLLILLN